MFRSPAAGAAARQLTASLTRAKSHRTTPLPLLKAAASSRLRRFNTSAALYGKVDIVVPQMAESISEGTLATIHKQIGEHIEADEEIASIETDKIDVAVNAPEGGQIIELHVAENDTVTVGQKIATLATGEDAGEAPKPSEKPESKEPEKPAPKEAEKPKEEAPAKPEPPKAEQHPTKPAQPPPSPPKPAQEQPPEPRPAQAGNRTERTEKMTRIRTTIARRLKESQNSTASLTAVQQLDMSALMKWRKENREAVMEKHGVKLGYMGAFVKATTLAAQEVSSVNAAMDFEGEAIVYRDFVDISIAVSTPRGLMTPVLRDTHTMDIIDIERGVAELAAKVIYVGNYCTRTVGADSVDLQARDNKLTLADLNGGNFSISNPGVFGSMFGTPVINYPQSAVFNMNGIKDEAVAVNGEVVIRPVSVP